MTSKEQIEKVLTSLVLAVFTVAAVALLAGIMYDLGLRGVFALGGFGLIAYGWYLALDHM
jgi:hypothetical protein